MALTVKCLVTMGLDQHWRSGDCATECVMSLPVLLHCWLPVGDLIGASGGVMHGAQAYAVSLLVCHLAGSVNNGTQGPLRTTVHNGPPQSTNGPPRDTTTANQSLWRDSSYVISPYGRATPQLTGMTYFIQRNNMFKYNLNKPYYLSLMPASRR